MRGSEERKQVLIEWDPHGAHHDAHGERADHEEPQEPEPGAAGSDQRGTFKPKHQFIIIKVKVGNSKYWENEAGGEEVAPLLFLF